MTSLFNLLNLGTLIGPRKIDFGLDSISNSNQTPFKPQIEAHLVGPTKAHEIGHLGKASWRSFLPHMADHPLPLAAPNSALMWRRNPLHQPPSFTAAASSLCPSLFSTLCHISTSNQGSFKPITSPSRSLKSCKTYFSPFYHFFLPFLERNPKELSRADLWDFLRSHLRPFVSIFARWFLHIRCSSLSLVSVDILLVSLNSHLVGQKYF